MSVRGRKSSLATQLGLAATLMLIAASGESLGQSTRSFQMGMWPGTCPGPQCPAVGVDTDIVSFGDKDPQPSSGRSIVLTLDFNTPLSTRNYDWSRVVAVEVDEPYGPQDDPRIDSIIKYPDGRPACQGDPTPYIAPIDALLAQRASELKALAPKARFWVNLTSDEAHWIGTCGTPQKFNRTYIDVLSADWYYADVAVLQPFYSIVAANRPKPDQQLALIPGTFYRNGRDDPVTQATHFQTYFPFANAMNQSCNLPLGPRGVTGSFDRCPVWIVFGWLSGDVQINGTGYVGELDPNSGAIRNAWRNELSLPLAAPLAHQLTPAQIIAPIVNQLLLNN